MKRDQQKWYVFKNSSVWARRQWLAAYGPNGSKIAYFPTHQEALDFASRQQCPHSDYYFDRTICQWPCDGMHYRCKGCDRVLDLGGCRIELGRAS